MRIVVAPDKFKGSLGAAAVARALADGIRHGPGGAAATVAEVPVADGGDGTLDALCRAGFAVREIPVVGPLGDPVTAQVAERGGTAAVETAQTAGLATLGGRARQPMWASSYGLGQAIGAALDGGAHEIVVGLGGSACTDGGAGMLQALGARLLDAEGNPIGRGGAALSRLRTLDLGPALRRLDKARLVAASDVANPLLGPSGAAAVYAPQKGASGAQVGELDQALRTLVTVAERGGAPPVAGDAGAGAAGGIGYALRLLGARISSGAGLVLDLLDIAAVLRGAELVVTGEGSLDAQTLQGKAPAAVAVAGARAGVPTVAVVGRNLLPETTWRGAGFARVYPLTDLEPDPARCIACAASLLRRAGTRVAADWVDRQG